MHCVNHASDVVGASGASQSGVIQGVLGASDVVGEAAPGASSLRLPTTPGT